MPVPVYDKVFSPAGEDFVNETHENLCCLQALSTHFYKTCVHTLDKGGLTEMSITGIF